MAKDTNVVSIPKEKFEFAMVGERIKDQKFDDKPIGYFRDAWNRFCKNKASIVAAIIILCIVLFAVIVPFFNPAEIGTVANTRYQNKVPRNLALSKIGLLTGDLDIQYNEKGFAYIVGIGIAADTDFENIPSVGEALEEKSPLMPVTKIDSIESVMQGRNEKLMYNAKVDDYLQVGFAYIDVEQAEYNAMLAWQEETGIQLIYPMIAENDYNFAKLSNDTNNAANWWYKTNSRGEPVRLNSKGEPVVIKYDDINELVLEENYQRDAEGNLVFYNYKGGGTQETAMYRVRTLYYNYYRYTHEGREPQFFFGTDTSGYDMAYRRAIGIRLSLLLAVCIFAINFVLGAMYGAVEGYYGGNVDLVLEFISYVLSGVPFIVVATLFQIHLAAKAGPIPSLLFAFVLTGWIGTASLVRTQFYRFKNQEYVMAARTLGARDRRIIWKHIFPNTLGTIITASVLAIPSVIFSESMLSYLGIVSLGSPTQTSVGTLLSNAESLWTTYPHLMLFPAAIISLLMICFNLFGNGLRDAFNPSLRGVEE